MNEVAIPADGVSLRGLTALPPDALGVVLFAHGTGSGRRSPRNTFVAQVLQRSRIGTVLLDLLTEDEDADPAARFDIELLTRRLLAVTRWAERTFSHERDAIGAGESAGAHPTPIGYFGASTGAAAALRAAAAHGDRIRAVVSRGGRPDLATDALTKVRAPTLLIVGGDDHGVVALNREAYARLHGPKQLVIVPGATHLFEEPGALDEVARLAAGWFARHFGAALVSP